MNRPAERLCKPQRGLLISTQLGREPILRAARAHADAAFQRAVDSALRLFELDRCDRPHSIPVAVYGPSGIGPLLITALPLPPTLRLTAPTRARAVVLVEDGAPTRRSGSRLLQALFGFSGTECCVAEALLAGAAPKAIAERFSVSENTVRTQIKALYAKTGTRRMATLLMTLSHVVGTRASEALEAESLVV